ncbi:hypothetical protein [Novosphingobium sp.]|uniref:hypothetical protein n=1 Tax=Novosphingobium sp. TaxID=1874826 RepID=UPI0025EDA259|nr:hypothetical protein [Novosphingobium sp.]MCC6926318.1 hypothetical protein [Novosphingobium sp.]
MKTLALAPFLFALTLVGCVSPPVFPPSPGPEPVPQAVIRVSAQGGNPTALRQGFLHGLSNGRISARTTSHLNALRPGVWRVSNLFGTHDFVVEQNLRARFGTKVTFNLQDLFSSRFGNPVVVGPDCLDNQPQHCFADYRSLRQEWSSFVDRFMLAAAERNGAGIDYFDIFSEPGSTLKGLNLEQIFDLLKVAHDTIRRHKPDALIVAPSIERFDGPGLDALFAFQLANGVRIDALSWHELEGSPQDVPAHIATARQLIARRFIDRPDLAPREIHVNEYGAPQNHLIPGWTVGWLAAFEAGGIDAANRACWPVSGGWTDCANGLDGLLLEDNDTPQPLLHLHRAWAELPRMRLVVQQAQPGLAVIAGRDQNHVALLVGRYGCGQNGKWCIGAPQPVQDTPAAPIDLRIEVTDLDRAANARVAIECYPNLALAGGLAQPQTRPEIIVPVVAGRLNLMLASLADGAACLVRIG